MALTLEYQPAAYYPAYHKNIWEVSSDKINEDEFKFVFELVNTLAGRTIKVSPRPTDGFGFIDLRRHIQDMLNKELFDIKEASVQQAAWANYSVRIKEQYKDGSGNTIIDDTIVYSSLAGLDLILDRNDLLTYDPNKWRLFDANSCLMWNVEDGLVVNSDDIFFIHFAITGLSQTLRFIVKEYFNNGTDNTIVEVVSVTGRAQLKTLDLASKLTSPSTTNRIEVWFEDVSLNQVSKKTTLFIEEPCSTYTRNRLIYLDSKGSRNSLNFDRVSNTTTTVKPKVFEKFINGRNEVDTSRGLTRFFVESEEITTINSAILSEKHNLMIQDLLKSTEVYLDVRNDSRFPDPSVEFVPVEILTRNFKDAKSENQQLLQQSIQYKFAFEELTR